LISAFLLSSQRAQVRVLVGEWPIAHDCGAPYPAGKAGSDAQELCHRVHVRSEFFIFIDKHSSGAVLVHTKLDLLSWVDWYSVHPEYVIHLLPSPYTLTVQAH